MQTSILNLLCYNSDQGLQGYYQERLNRERRRDKGSDASWRNDQEPPREALDFSDDEKEREAKQKKKKKKQQNYGDKNTQCGE
ncbi:hypothetical protein scyTo_0016297 [Scyliorhinus torazame]|uniref:Uncharacterized protein n=1 Tax=Scyliorhinus torazame TaxID=75743 RepID=A0A401Q5I8_SCYTO|nr:hypothetical protein [Scyliorhinus torazame]